MVGSLGGGGGGDFHRKVTWGASQKFLKETESRFVGKGEICFSPLEGTN